MSDSVSALGGATYQGFVQVEELGPRGMITLRGDLGSNALSSAVREVAGTAVPGQRAILAGDDRAVAWMSPDELLILLPYADAPAATAQLAEALKEEHALAVEVSDARAMFRLTGAAVREVVAKLAPVDMSAGAFAPGQIRRTRFAQVAAAVWMPDETTAEIICFRSVAAYMFGLLKAAATPGSEVGAGL